jgi:hypothetical protein
MFRPSFEKVADGSIWRLEAMHTDKERLSDTVRMGRGELSLGDRFQGAIQSVLNPADVLDDLLIRPRAFFNEMNTVGHSISRARDEIECDRVAIAR